MKALRRALAVLAAFCILLGLLALGLSAWVVHEEKPRILTDGAVSPGRLDCILVLGCGLGPDGRPRPMLTDRMIQGVTLYRLGWADTLLLSGDRSGDGYDEPGAMRDWAVARGVPEEDILLDNEGFSTAESMDRARNVFGMKRVMVVTQAYHLYRALYLAEARGMEAWGLSATLRGYGPKQILWTAREILARDREVLRTVFS